MPFYHPTTKQIENIEAAYDRKRRVRIKYVFSQHHVSNRSYTIDISHMFQAGDEFEKVIDLANGHLMEITKRMGQINNIYPTVNITKTHIEIQYKVKSHIGFNLEIIESMLGILKEGISKPYISSLLKSLYPTTWDTIQQDIDDYAIDKVSQLFKSVIDLNDHKPFSI